MVPKHVEHKHRTFNGPTLEHVGRRVGVLRIWGVFGNAVLVKHPPRNPRSWVRRGVPRDVPKQEPPFPRAFLDPFLSRNRPSQTLPTNLPIHTQNMQRPFMCIHHIVASNGMHPPCTVSQRPHHGLVAPQLHTDVQRAGVHHVPHFETRDACPPKAPTAHSAFEMPFDQLVPEFRGNTAIAKAAGKIGAMHNSPMYTPLQLTPRLPLTVTPMLHVP